MSSSFLYLKSKLFKLTWPRGLMSTTCSDLCSSFKKDNCLLSYSRKPFSSKQIMTRQQGMLPEPQNREKLRDWHGDCRGDSLIVVGIVYRISLIKWSKRPLVSVLKALMGYYQQISICNPHLCGSFLKAASRWARGSSVRLQAIANNPAHVARGNTEDYKDINTLLSRMPTPQRCSQSKMFKIEICIQK